MVPPTSAMRTASAANLRIHLHLLLLHRTVAVTVTKLPTSSIFLSPPYVGHVKVCYYDVSHVQCWALSCVSACTYYNHTLLPFSKCMICTDSHSSNFFPPIRYFLHTNNLQLESPSFFFLVRLNLSYTPCQGKVCFGEQTLVSSYIANPSIYLQFAHAYIIILSRNLILGVKNGDIV